VDIGAEFIAAGIRLDFIGQNLEQRRLAAAICTQQTDLLVTPDHQVHAAEDLAPAETLAQILADNDLICR